MADAITIQELIDARTDAKTLEEAVNGDVVTTVLSRLGESYPTLANALNQIDGQISDANDMLVESVTTLFENGGLPATPFATKALMESSDLPSGSYAIVTDDTVNNGLYVKTAGAWVKSEYDPLTQAKSYTDTAKSSAISTAAGDATTKANAAELSAKAYVDEKIKIILNDPEYILCISDRDSNLLFAITWQGEVIGDFKILLENISDLPTVLSHKDNIEGELYEIADPQGNILAQVESDGTWVLPAIRTTALDSTEITGGNLNLGEFTEAGITKEKFIRVPEQNYLRLDLNLLSLPTDTSDARLTKTGTCTISDSSKNIIYAKTNMEMAVQGNASQTFKKKNYTIDFYNIDGDELELKFGDSIASDSYHLKGFYSDPSHMREQGGYRCWKELVQKLDYPYSKINNIVYSASPSRPTNAEFTADAKYYPHGFPVEVYLNSNFYGLYTLRLKKTRTNYALDNANTDHIFLDSGTYSAFLREPFDATDWEIKSPKMSGYKDLGLIPPAFTETVGASCARLFEFTRTLSTSYPNHADYIVLPHWILWYLMCELTGDWDHNGNNYNIITWNNQQWSIIPYDLDWTLNWTTGFGNMQSTDLLSSDIWTTFRTVFTPEIKSLWTKYRKNGDITVENVVKHYRNAVSNVPREIYKADKEKWGSSHYFGDVNYPDLEQVYRWFEARIEYLDSKYLIA